VIDALIFDFDGVVVDSEPVHLACFQQILADHGVALSREDYYTKYLGFDDRDCFAAALQAAGKTSTGELISRMTADKTLLVQRAFAESIKPLSGAVELIRSAAAAGVPVGVCSGALRREIELAARTVGALEHFSTIVAADDVQKGKPDPQGYHMALEQLAKISGRKLAAVRCVVVEDAPAGISAAKAAGMRVLAVTNSYPTTELSAADRIVHSLTEVSAASLEELI